MRVAPWLNAAAPLGPVWTQRFWMKLATRSGCCAITVGSEIRWRVDSHPGVCVVPARPTRVSPAYSLPTPNWTCPLVPGGAALRALSVALKSGADLRASSWAWLPYWNRAVCLAFMIALEMSPCWYSPSPRLTSSSTANPTIDGMARGGAAMVSTVCAALKAFCSSGMSDSAMAATLRAPPTAPNAWPAAVSAPTACEAKLAAADADRRPFCSSGMSDSAMAATSSATPAAPSPSPSGVVAPTACEAKLAAAAADWRAFWSSGRSEETMLAIVRAEPTPDSTSVTSSGINAPSPPLSAA